MILSSPFHVPKPRRCTAAQGPPQDFANHENVGMPEARRTDIQWWNDLHAASRKAAKQWPELSQ